MKKFLLVGLVFLSMTGFTLAEGPHHPVHHPAHHRPVHHRHPVHHPAHHQSVHHHPARH